jgi:hypothetical protein
MRSVANFKNNEVVIPKLVTITFATAPTTVTIKPTFYRYNKTFAMSWGFDNGNLDAYQTAVAMYNGGTVVYKDGTTLSYPGLSYTDGTGSKKQFAGTLNLNMSNVANIDSPVDFMNYIMLQDAYVKGFDLSNNGYTNRSASTSAWSTNQATKDIEILNEIDSNYTSLKDNTGIKFQNFSPPNNDANYDPYSVSYINSGKMKVSCSLNNATSKYGHDTGLTAEYWIEQKGLGFSRDYATWSDALVTRTASDFDVINNKLTSVGNQHAWFTFGTKKVGQTESVTPASGTQRYLSFKWLMEGLESRYGTSGNDTMWFASINDVYEYMVCARDAKIKTIKNGSKVNVTFDFSSIPQEFRTHSLSLLVNSDAAITSITYTGFDEQSSLINYKGLGSNTALINIGYKPIYEKTLNNKLKAAVAIKKAELTKTQEDLTIAKSLITAIKNGAFKTALQARSNSIVVVVAAVVVDPVVMQIDFGQNTPGYALSSPWNTFGVTTPGIAVGSKLLKLIATTAKATNINIEVIAAFSAFDSNVPFTITTTGLPFPFEVCRDVFVAAANTIATLRLSNLDVTKKYDFEFYASRGYIGNLSQYTVKGTTVSIAHKTNTTGTVKILNVTADAGGTLDIQVKGDAANAGYIGFIQLTERV